MNDFTDPYINQELGILRNLVGATTRDELNEIEREISYSNELKIGEIPNTHDFTELSAIHKMLFSDIYDWAGQIRTVDIRKPNQEYFLIHSQISTALDYIFSELQKEKYLTDVPKEIFVKKLAYFYEQLNFIHPFREGNGRAQRIFWSRVAKNCGFIIDWDAAIGNELNIASIAGHENQDLKPLEKMFSRIIKPL